MGDSLKEELHVVVVLLVAEVVDLLIRPCGAFILLLPFRSLRQILAIQASRLARAPPISNLLRDPNDKRKLTCTKAGTLASILKNKSA